MVSRLNLLRAVTALSFAAGISAIIVACGSSGPEMPTGPAGGAVAGVVDMHCVGPTGLEITQATDQTKCMFRPPPDAAVDAHVALPDAAPGTPDAGPDAGPVSDYGPTMFNQAGDDDDCKYHVSWTSTPIYENTDITFTMTATTLVDPGPVTGDVGPIIEAFLSDTHPAPDTNQHAVETAPGVYTIGPIQFDAPGMWTVRFHLFEQCFDLIAQSPHGHAAFYVNVP